MASRVRKAIFPVAGLATRFLPATKAVPKEMLPVLDRPLIDYAVDEARAAGIERLVFVTGRGTAVLEDHFGLCLELEAGLEAQGKTAELAALRAGLPPPGAVVFLRQEQPLGLGHAVWCGRHEIGDEPFAVILPDDLVLAGTPCLEQMVKAHSAVGGNMVAVVEVPREQTGRYGILDVEADDGRLVRARGLVEKPPPDEAPSTLSIIGRYILQPQVFEALGHHRRGVGGEVQLTDAIAGLIGRQPFHGFRFEGRRYDCGDRLGLLEANLAVALAGADTGPEARAMARRCLEAAGP